MDNLSQQLKKHAPETISIFLDGQEILRIQGGEVVLDQPVNLSLPHWLLTIHFDSNPQPEYWLQIA